MVTTKKVPVFILAFANAKTPGLDYLNSLSEEEDQILNTLQAAIQDGLCEVEHVYQANFKQIIRAFRKHQDRVALFYFSGHATSYSLILEDQNKVYQELQMDSFGHFLASLPHLDIVILNSCATKAQSLQLINLGIPIVISSKNCIIDVDGKHMAIHFFTEIGMGTTVQKAYEKSLFLTRSILDKPIIRRGLHRQANSEKLWHLHYAIGSSHYLNWNLPEQTNNYRYSLPRLAKIPFPNDIYPGLASYQEKDRLAFWGRDKYIYRFYQQVTSQTAYQVFLLHGKHGVGKTSLLQAGLLPYFKTKFQQIKYLSKVKDWPDDLASIHLDLLIIDQPSSQLIGEVNVFLQKNKHCKLLLILPSTELAQWEGSLDSPKQILYLPPPSFEEIKYIIQGGYQSILTKYHPIEIDGELLARLAHLFAEDTNSPQLPVLQFCLKRLWGEVSKKYKEKYIINWATYEQVNQDELWMDYLQTQLAQCDQPFLISGLLLNLLDETIKRGDKNGFIQKQVLEKRFSNDHLFTQNAIQQLIKNHLLSISTLDNKKTERQISISHQILIPYIQQLVNLSLAPGQELLRRLYLHKKNNTFLSLETLNELKQWPEALPSPSIQEQQLIDHSKDHHKKRILRLRQKRYLHGSIFLFLFILGFQLPAPLLLFALILYTTYQWMNTIKV